VNKKEEKEALAALVTTTRAIRQLRKKNLALFEKLEALQRDEEKLATALKDSVRARVVEENADDPPKGKISVYSTEDVLVQALMKTAPKGYDVEIARAEWPRAVFNAAAKIDPKKADALVTEGKLSEELARKATEEKKVLTAAITIDVLGGGK